MGYAPISSRGCFSYLESITIALDNLNHTDDRKCTTLITYMALLIASIEALFATLVDFQLSLYALSEAASTAALSLFELLAVPRLLSNSAGLYNDSLLAGPGRCTVEGASTLRFLALNMADRLLPLSHTRTL